jgi:purine-binding chemotaxis protein CheW
VLIFRLDGRDHAFGVQDVIEVVRMVAVTPLPDGLPWVAGVLNYRGRVIPVIDARARLGLPRRAPDLSTPIIVLAADDQAAALVVDEAVEVLALPAGTVEPADRVSGASGLVAGVARPGTRLIVLLDAARLCAECTDGYTEDARPGGGAYAAAS